MNKEKKFAEGICFKKLFWIFLIGCIFGTYYEQILTLVKGLLSTGSIIWESRRGVIYGPFSPVYGLGAVLMTYVLARKERPMYQTFIYGALLGGITELSLGFLQETFIGTVSWDYSSKFLNIAGKTTIPFMFFWGLLGVLFVKYIYPPVSNFIESFPLRQGTILTSICVMLMSVNMLISWTALFRQTLRRNDIGPITFVGQLYDKIYTDDFLSKYFPNMVPTDVQG